MREGKIPDLPVGNTVAGVGDSKWKRNINYVACISTKSHYLSYKTFQYAICEVRAV